MIANEYAKALFQLAKEKHDVKNIHDQFRLLIDSINQNPDFYKVLSSPKFFDIEKKEILKNVCNSFSETLKNFLFVLIDNGSISELKKIYDEFNIIALAMDKIMMVDVYSAVDLSDKEKSILSKKLIKIFKCNEIIIHNFVDSRLIGGIKVIANGKSLDLSLRDKLNQLKSAI